MPRMNYSQQCCWSLLSVFPSDHPLRLAYRDDGGGWNLNRLVEEKLIPGPAVLLGRKKQRGESTLDRVLDRGTEATVLQQFWSLYHEHGEGVCAFIRFKDVGNVVIHSYLQKRMPWDREVMEILQFPEAHALVMVEKRPDFGRLLRDWDKLPVHPGKRRRIHWDDLDDPLCWEPGPSRDFYARQVLRRAGEPTDDPDRAIDLFEELRHGK